MPSGFSAGFTESMITTFSIATARACRTLFGTTHGGAKRMATAHGPISRTTARKDFGSSKITPFAATVLLRVGLSTLRTAGDTWPGTTRSLTHLRAATAGEGGRNVGHVREVYDNAFNWTIGWGGHAQRSGGGIWHDNAWSGIDSNNQNHTSLAVFREI